MIVINPYKRYPIYTHRVSKIYLGKRRNECPVIYTFFFQFAIVIHMIDILFELIPINIYSHIYGQSPSAHIET